MKRKNELIEKYLMGGMSIKEQAEFEEALKNDPGLKEEFILRRDINNAILEKDIIDLRSTLESITGLDTPTKKIPLKIYKYTAVAAVLILFIVVGNLYLNPFQKISHQEVFNTYYQVYPSINGYRSAENGGINKNLYFAFNYYDDGEYAKAAEYFEKVLEKEGPDIMNQFYLAICYIENEEFTKAEEVLISLTLSQNHIFWEQAHWYLAMVYTEKGNTENAKSVLQKVVKEGMYKKGEAKSILRLLK